MESVFGVGIWLAAAGFLRFSLNGPVFAGVSAATFVFGLCGRVWLDVAIASGTSFPIIPRRLEDRCRLHSTLMDRLGFGNR